MPDKFSRIHPDLQKAAKSFPGFITNPKLIWLVNWLAYFTPASKPAQGVVVKEALIPSQDQGTKIRLRIYKPAVSPERTPVLVWMHGGGYVIGKPEMDDRICSRFVEELGIIAVSVDYRLAPQHPFPTGLEDCYAALKWVKAHAAQLGADEKRIGIGGGSAGGGLAAALAQLAYDRHEVVPIFQLLVYPMLDDRTILRAEIDDRSNITWSQDSNRYGWKSYLGKHFGKEDVPECAVPARRADLSGLPPAWIGVGALDIFCDEDTAYAQRLQGCGIECELKVVPGAFHGFDVFDPAIPLIQEFQQSQIAALKKYLFA